MVNTDDLVAAVLADPEALWKLRTAVVVGPWEEATSKKRKVTVHGGQWRCLPDGKDVALVRESRNPDGMKPQEHDYTSYALWDDETGESIASFDDELYAEHLAEWEKDMEAWKPWTWSQGLDKGYADTEADAKALADKVLRRQGVLLCDSVTDLKRVSRAELLRES